MNVIAQIVAQINIVRFIPFLYDFETFFAIYSIHTFIHAVGIFDTIIVINRYSRNVKASLDVKYQTLL